ncbi:hypothetical protein O988_09745, partial [Pseudogymnoascus sp. VKM F-3808]
MQKVPAELLLVITEEKSATCTVGRDNSAQTWQALRPLGVFSGAPANAMTSRKLKTRDAGISNATRGRCGDLIGHPVQLNQFL